MKKFQHITKHLNRGGLICILQALFIAATSLLYSCSNLTDDNFYSPAYSGTETVSIKGKVSVNGALPAICSDISTIEEKGRTALPSTSGYNYFITAENSSESINGSITDGVYTIELILGHTYTITAGLKKPDQDPVLKAEWPDVTTTRENAGSLTHNFILMPASGKGNIELPISIASSVTNITSVKIKWGDAEESLSSPYSISKTDVSAGTYEVPLSFYDSNGFLLYFTNQTITVLANMTTDTWTDSGSILSPVTNPSATKPKGKFEVTDEIITSFGRTQIYVGTVGTKAGDDTNGSGSPYAPFASIGKAIQLIKSSGNSTNDYTIWISGEVTGGSTLSTDINSTNAGSVTICGLNGLDSNEDPKDILNGSSSSRVINIETLVPVTLDTIKITNGKADKEGGGVRIWGTSDTNRAKVTLRNVLITGNKISGNNSDGFAFYGKYADISMESGSISNNDGTEYIDQHGALAIYNSTFTMNGGKISGNKVKHFAGNIYLNGGSEFILNDGEISEGIAESSQYDVSAGGVWIDGNARLTMKGGTIKNNQAKHTGSTSKTASGGAIYIANGTFDMQGGVMTGNEVIASEKRGGAICSHKGTNNNSTNCIQISGNAKITQGNEAGKNDVWLNTNDDNSNPAKIVITGELTATAPVATITASTFTLGKQVIAADTGLSLTQTILNKFAMSDDSWMIKLSGNTGVIDSPIFLVGANHSDNVSDVTESKQEGTKSFPFSKLSDAIAVCNNSGSDYTIIVDGKVTGTNAGGTIGSSVNAKSITIQGARGSSNDVLDRGLTNNDAIENGTVLTISKNIPITIQNLKITGGNTSGDGGGINISAGSVTIKDGTEISGNKAVDGGGIISGGSLKLAGGTISGNTASNRGGGIYNNGGTIFLYGSALIGDATETIAKSDSYSNSANIGGGIYGAGSNKIYIGYKNEETVDSEFSGGICRNFASEDGGAIYITSAAEKFEIAKGSISYNAAGNDGGAIYNATSLNLNDEAKISNNNAEKHGGAVYNYGTFVMKKGEISENTVNGSGGGVYNLKSFTFEDGKINSNTAKSNTAKGGGVLTAGYRSNFTMTGGEITGNTVDNNNEGPNGYTSGGAGVAMGSYSSGPTTPYAGTLKITGGSIHDNILNKSGTDANTQVVGSGVFVIRAEESKFIAGENVNIYKDNIYVDQDQKIYICSTLSKYSQSENLKVTLDNPAGYESTALLVKDDSAASDIVSSEYNKFSIQNPGDGGKNWITLNDGKLQQAIGTKKGFSLKDIVFNDGSTMAYSSDITLTTLQKQNAVAVIGWYSGSTWYGIGLKEPNTTGKPWTDSSSLKGYASVGATSDDGLTNMSKITGLSDFNYNNYPAFWWAANYKTEVTNLGIYSDNNWYIPSAKELQGIFGQLVVKLSSIMSDIGTAYATPYRADDYYMTSSENGNNNCKAVSGSSPSTFASKPKTNNLRVRAIHKFE